jgi:hypothetical protein
MALLAAPLLVAPSLAIPPSFAVETLTLAQGIPTAFALAEGLNIVVTLPTGDLRRWQRSDPSALLSDSTDERAPFRLGLTHSGRLVASLPCVRGKRSLLPETGQALAEIIPLDWSIRVGDAIAPGRRGSFIVLAWRPVAVPSNYSAPSAGAAVRMRLSGNSQETSEPLPTPNQGGLEWERRHG